jgi:hypothetical protein
MLEDTWSVPFDEIVIPETAEPFEVLPSAQEIVAAAPDGGFTVE